jgi:hypothetical protein
LHILGTLFRTHISMETEPASWELHLKCAENLPSDQTNRISNEGLCLHLSSPCLFKSQLSPEIASKTLTSFYQWCKILFHCNLLVSYMPHYIWDNIITYLTLKFIRKLSSVGNNPWTLVSAVRVKFTNSAFGDKRRWMLKIIQRFGKHCSWHLRSKYVMNGLFWRFYEGLAVSGYLDLIVLIAGAEERAAALFRYVPPTPQYLNRNT